MDGIVRLAVSVLTEIVALECVKVLAPHFILAAVLGSLAFAAAAGALGCGAAALWIALLPVISPWGAPVVCAGILLFAAVILVTGGFCLLRGRDRTTAAARALAAAIEGGDLAPLVREHKWLLMALTILGGLTAAGKLGKDPARKP